MLVIKLAKSAPFESETTVLWFGTRSCRTASDLKISNNNKSTCTVYAHGAGRFKSSHELNITLCWTHDDVQRRPDARDRWPPGHVTCESCGRNGALSELRDLGEVVANVVVSGSIETVNTTWCWRHHESLLRRGIEDSGPTYIQIYVQTYVPMYKNLARSSSLRGNSGYRLSRNGPERRSITMHPRLQLRDRYREFLCIYFKLSIL